MPLTSATSDPEALTLTLVGDYPVSVERLWQAYTDPRQIEKFWGPVECPATFTHHDVTVGGVSRYYLTAPDGTQHLGSWRFLKVEPLRTIELEDGDSGTAEEDVPGLSRMVFHFEKTANGSRFTGVTHFADLEAMERILQMGMLEGMKSAASQIDAVLAAPIAHTASAGE